MTGLSGFALIYLIRVIRFRAAGHSFTHTRFIHLHCRFFKALRSGQQNFCRHLQRHHEAEQ